MSMVRAQAEEWYLNPSRIGVIGFSAGGHLAAALGANLDKRSYPALDEADRYGFRPNFSTIIYPGIMISSTDPSALAPRSAPTARTGMASCQNPHALRPIA